MQGLADGYFVIPYTLAHYLGSNTLPRGQHRRRRVPRGGVGGAGTHRHRCSPCKGSKTPRQLHRELGPAAVERGRHGAQRRRAAADARERFPQLRDEFWQNVSVPGPEEQSEQESRVRGPRRRLPRVRGSADARRAAAHESCGGHFREESQTPDGEALRDDAKFAYAAAWEFRGVGTQPALHKEPLVFEYVKPSQRSYK